MRHASVDEAAAIAHLVNLAYEVEYFFVEGDRTNADEVRALMATGVFLVAEGLDGMIVGCIYVEIDGEAGSFGLLAVDPAAQGHGWGRQLIEAAETHVRDAGAHTIQISVVNLRADLFPLYRRFGYEEAGRAPYVPHRIVKQPCQFVVMTKALNPV